VPISKGTIKVIENLQFNLIDLLNEKTDHDVVVGLQKLHDNNVLLQSVSNIIKAIKGE
jgi:hypothetical protein